MTEATDTATDEARTIDDLAREVGMSVRNLREWRSLGLLPAPTMVGRSGRYGDDVVERVRTIQRLHGDGFPLDLIRRLLDDERTLAADVVALAETVRAPLHRARVGHVGDAVAPPEGVWEQLEPDHVVRAVDLGLVELSDDGQLVFPGERIARVGDALARMGLTVDQMLDATAEVRAHLDSVAGVFEQLWLDHVWEPFVRAGMPEDGRAGVASLLAEMPDRAFDGVTALFSAAIADRIGSGIVREATRALDADA